MFLLYNLAFTFGVLVTAPYYLWRHRNTRLGRIWWRERLGYLPPEFRQRERGAIWIHAVSVGETLAVAGLVKAIRERYPDRKIFISHVTPAGRQAGEKRLSGVAGRFYLPLDGSGCVSRVLNTLKPGLLIIVETELWPNLLRMTHRSGGCVALVNARLSDRSYPGYRLFRPFMRRVLANFDCILTQTLRDRERFCALGADAARVIAIGNLKFDGEAPEPTLFPKVFSQALHAAHRSPVLVAASTMAGEEELLIKAWERIRLGHPHALLILAPRHPARFEQVANLLASARMGFVRRTSLSDPSDSGLSCRAAELAKHESNLSPHTALPRGEGGEPVRPSAANGPARSEGAQGKLGEPGEGSWPGLSALTAMENAVRSPAVVLLDTIGELAAIFELADVVYIGGSLVPTGGHNLIEPARSGKPVVFGPHMENFRDIAEIFLQAKAARRVETWAQMAAEVSHLFEADEERLALGRAARCAVEQESGATRRILDHISEMLEQAGSPSERAKQSIKNIG